MATEQQQQLIEAVPESGEIAYEELHTQLTVSGRSRLLNYFHQLRRAGEIQSRVKKDGKLYVSRPGTQLQPEE